MGCDIHLYVEYSDDGKRWRNFAGRLNPGRYYGLFNVIAGVRGNEDQLYTPRGLPDDISWRTASDNRLYIVPDGPGDNNDEDSVMASKAKEWVEKGYSKYTDDDKKFISHPDWHSHSWLEVAEFSRALEVGDGHGEEYGAVLAAMEFLASKGNKVRVVFWFDN